MRTQIRKIGNSLGNIIPATLIRQLDLSEGADIEVKVVGQKIIIEPIQPKKKPLPFSESDVLQGLNAHTAHADELADISAAEIGE